MISNQPKNTPEIQILPVQVKLVKQPINNILKLSIEAMDW